MALADDIITTINSSLTNNLSWLTTAYGKIQKLPRIDSSGKEVKNPEIYLNDKGEYINLLPDEHLGCYSYFQVIEDINYQNVVKNIRSSFRFKIVFWFDFRTIFPSDWESRSIEEVKNQVLAVLVGTPYSQMVSDFKCYEYAEDIYSGFTHKEIKHQFLMRPFGGFAFEGEVIGTVACSLNTPAPVIPTNIARMLPFVHSLTSQVWPMEKWIGNKAINVQTFFYASGSDSALLVTTIPDNAYIFKVLKTSSIGDNDNNGGAELIKEGGVYKLFAPSQELIIYLTIWSVPA